MVFFKIFVIGSLAFFSLFLEAKIFWTPLIISSPLVSVAGVRTETYRDVIDKAHNLIIYKDRAQAITLLVNSIRKESKKNAAPAELYTSLEEICINFLSDKAQQLYELSLSLRNSDLKTATQKIDESLKIENDNYLSLVEKARLALAASDCSLAESLMTKIREQNPFIEFINLAFSQSQICLGKFDNYLQIKETIDLKKSILSPFWNILHSEYLFKKADFQKAYEFAKQVYQSNEKYPESLYWMWKNSQSLKKEDEKSGQKYLTNCKKISPRTYREWGPDPFLCRRVLEVETSLKKNNN